MSAIRAERDYVIHEDFMKVHFTLNGIQFEHNNYCRIVQDVNNHFKFSVVVKLVM